MHIDNQVNSSSQGITTTSFLERQHGMGNILLFLRRLRKHPSAQVGLFVIVLYFLMAVFAPLLAPHSGVQGDLLERLQPPVWLDGGNWKHVLGSDEQGMDLLSRII